MKKGMIHIKWNNASVRIKMLISFLTPLLLILFTNIYMYVNINTTIEKVNKIYVTNINLNELSDQLTLLQTSMKEYLENKGTTSLNNYYKAEQNYRDALGNMNSQWSDTKMYAMQENIYNQSLHYFEVSSDTIQAKRGRNVEKYKASYEETVLLSQDLQYSIYALNNDRFRSNMENYSILLASLKSMEFITLLVLIIVTIVSIVVVLLITRSMTTPLTELSYAANEVAKGNFDVNIETSEDKDEISVVSNAFMQMVNSVKKYITEITESMHRESELKEHELVMAGRMKEVQLRSLQAQINPHFLFNTLNAGSQLAMMEGADKTVEFIDNMADFFRYNIKKINNDATIGEEINMVDRYIYILNVRFTGEIHFSKDIDSDVLDVRVPSMILQPIVENAVNYGIRDIDWEGHIDLKVYREGLYVYMSVKDNGIGISKEKIEDILSGTSKGEATPEKSDSNGVGLGNVIERLQIFTGMQDVISICSEGEGKGAEFIIKVPLVV